MTLRKITKDNSVRYASKQNNSQNVFLPKYTKPKTASILKKHKVKHFQKIIKSSKKIL